MQIDSMGKKTTGFNSYQYQVRLLDALFVEFVPLFEDQEINLKLKAFALFLVI